MGNGQPLAINQIFGKGGNKEMNLSIIGGADGPTSIFIESNASVGWLNVFGLIIVILIMVPNIIYAIKFKNQENKCINKYMIIMEQIGRYTSLFFMIFNIGIAEFGFSSLNAFIAYLICNLVLLLIYWTVWIFYIEEQKTWNSLLLAILPTVIFLITGITLMHVLLVISSLLFGIGHIYITYKNVKHIF